VSLDVTHVSCSTCVSEHRSCFRHCHMSLHMLCLFMSRQDTRLRKSASNVLQAHTRLSLARRLPRTVKLARQIRCRRRAAVSPQRVAATLDGQDQTWRRVRSALRASIVLIRSPSGLTRAVLIGTSRVKQHRARFVAII